MSVNLQSVHLLLLVPHEEEPEKEHEEEPEEEHEPEHEFEIRTTTWNKRDCFTYNCNCFVYNLKKKWILFQILMINVK